MSDEAMREAARALLDPGALGTFVDSLDDATVETLCRRLASEASDRWLRSQPGWSGELRCVTFKFCYMPAGHDGPCADGLAWLKGIPRSAPPAPVRLPHELSFACIRGDDCVSGNEVDEHGDLCSDCQAAEEAFSKDD